MKKSYKFINVLSGAIFFFSMGLQAAEVTVDRGSDTLRNAIAAASAGDVLILQDGVYTVSNDDLVIDKSLTIRAVNAAATPRLYFLSGGSIPAISIQGANTDFIMQGIYYYEGAAVTNQPGFIIEGDVKSVALLENQFISINVEVRPTYDEDSNKLVMKDLIIVGNVFAGGLGSLYNIGAKDNFLFAGNEVSYTQLRPITYGAEAHIIGNSFIHNTNVISLTSNASIGSYTRIIGNSIRQTLSAQTGQSVTNSNFPVMTLAGDGEFSNNIVQQGLNPYSATGTPGAFRLIQVSSNGSGSLWQIKNNTFDVKASALYDDSPVYNDAFNFAVPVTFENNIIVGNVQPTLFTLTTAQSQQLSTFSNNLCFDNVAACDLGDNSIEADPEFVNDTDYSLGEGSPAIDAGVASEAYRDVDGSPIDLGVHGGAFSYLQFAKQLTENTVEPYFYPLFEANRSLSNTGALKVKAVAIARQR
jgi:hypothetical protein